GRFDEVVEIPLPDEESRRKIFEVHLRKKPLAPGISAADLASRTADFSGAEIQAVCAKAALRAVRRALRGTGLKLQYAARCGSRLLAAAHLAGTRLIDNLRVN
ncbi:MAG: hypothetical protein AAB036_10265, partial [Elusimicrobiota bacterium]